MNAHDLSTAASAAAALPTSNPGSASSLDLLAARTARDGLRSLLGAERDAAAEFLLALADFDAHRGWESLGHANLFAFLRTELGLSKGGAHFRLTAAKLIQRFPEVIGPLRDGRLCITTVVELAKVLTVENRASVLPRFFGCSSAEAREVVAAIAPREAPPLKMVVTPLSEPRRIASAPVAPDAVEPPAAPEAGPVVGTEAEAAPRGEVQLTEPTCPTRVIDRRAEIEPLTADLRRLHVTVSARLLKKLDAARDGLSRTLLNATAEQVLEAALDLLLEKQARARGQVKRPRTAAIPPNATAIEPVAAGAAGELAPVHHRRAGPRLAIPAAVKRAVWERDGGRCCWPLDGGGTCGSTHRLELDHVLPWARGGESTITNLRIACHAHNTAASRASFGAQVAGRYGSPA